MGKKAMGKHGWDMISKLQAEVNILVRRRIPGDMGKQVK